MTRKVNMVGLRQRANGLLRLARIAQERTFGDGFAISTAEDMELLRGCEEEYLRDPYRERLSAFRRIIQTFGLQLDNKRIVDLGPGHMGFFEMCKRLAKPRELIGVERSATLLKIGQRRGYTMIDAELTSDEFVARIPPKSVDLLFCRGSLNPCAIADFSHWWERVSSLLAPKSSVWIYPWWDGAVSTETANAQKRVVVEALTGSGVRLVPAPPWLARGYKVHFTEIWIR